MVDIISLSMTISSTLVCNVLALLCVVFKESKTTLKDRIIILLCFANCLQTIGYSVSLEAYITGSITMSTCVFSAFLLCSLTYSSIGYLVALTLERYIAIKYPYRYHVWINQNVKTWIWLFIPLLLGFLFGVAPILGWGKYGQTHQHSSHCGFDFRDDSSSAKSYLIFVVICVLVVPIIISARCFCGILFELRRTAAHHRRNFGKCSTIFRSSNKSVNQQYVASALTGLVYFTSWVPYGVVCFMMYYRVPVPLSFEYVAMYMAKSATVSSPIIYCLIEKQFCMFIKGRCLREDEDAREENV